MKVFGVLLGVLVLGVLLLDATIAGNVKVNMVNWFGSLIGIMQVLMNGLPVYMCKALQSLF
jgi:hypothetical protein